MTAPNGETPRYTADELRIILARLESIENGEDYLNIRRAIVKTRALLAEATDRESRGNSGRD